MNQIEKVSSFPALDARGSAARVTVLIAAMVTSFWREAALEREISIRISD